jgi:hypothetical protein
VEPTRQAKSCFFGGEKSHCGNDCSEDQNPERGVNLKQKPAVRQARRGRPPASPAREKKWRQKREWPGNRAGTGVGEENVLGDGGLSTYSKSMERECEQVLM